MSASGVSLRGGWQGFFPSTQACFPATFNKGALSWYGKLTWESAHAWILMILCYLIVWGITLIFMVRLSFYIIMLVRLLVEVDMFSVFPYYGFEKEKTILFDIKCHDSYLMKCLHNNIGQNDTIC